MRPVYSGEFLADGSHVPRFAGSRRERFLRPTDETARNALWVDYVHSDQLELFDQLPWAAVTE